MNDSMLSDPSDPCMGLNNSPNKELSFCLVILMNMNLCCLMVFVKIY